MHHRCAWDGAKLRPCLSVAARQLGPAELKVVKGEPGIKAGLHTAAAATADADVEVTGSRSREQRDAEGFRNAQVLQGGDGDDDGDDDEAASPLRPGGDGGAVLKRSRKK